MPRGYTPTTRMDVGSIDEMARLEDTHWWFVGKRLLVEPLLRAAGAGRALDVGCGTGGVLALLAQARSAVGADASADCLTHCRRRGLAPLVRATADHLPFRRASFALVTALDVIEHADDDVAVLREIRAALAPGGVLVVGVPAYPALWSDHDEVLGHRRRYTAPTLRAALTAAQFDVLRLTYTNAFVLPAAAVWRLGGRRVLNAGGGRTDFYVPPAKLNRLLIGLYRIEAWLTSRTRLPFGLSLLCLAQPCRDPSGA
jgi:SAM-dependent methyltransferase